MPKQVGRAENKRRPAKPGLTCLDGDGPEVPVPHVTDRSRCLVSIWTIWSSTACSSPCPGGPYLCPRTYPREAGEDIRSHDLDDGPRGGWEETCRPCEAIARSQRPYWDADIALIAGLAVDRAAGRMVPEVQGSSWPVSVPPAPDDIPGQRPLRPRFFWRRRLGRREDPQAFLDHSSKDGYPGFKLARPPSSAPPSDKKFHAGDGMTEGQSAMTGAWPRGVHGSGRQPPPISWSSTVTSRCLCAAKLSAHRGGWA